MGLIRAPLSCFLSLFGFSSPGQRSGGIGEIWFITRGKKKKRHRETSGKFCNFRQEKGQTPGLGQDELAAFQACLEEALVCVCVSVHAHTCTTRRPARSSRGPMALSSCLSFCLLPPSSLPGPLSVFHQEPVSPLRCMPGRPGMATPAGNIVTSRAPPGLGTPDTQGNALL